MPVGCVLHPAVVGQSWRPLQGKAMFVQGKGIAFTSMLENRLGLCPMSLCQSVTYSDLARGIQPIDREDPLWWQQQELANKDTGRTYEAIKGPQTDF